MRRVPLLLSCGILSLGWLLSPLAASPSPADFEGIWVGEIVAPNTRTELGLAFTRTEKGLLVSLNFPAMFLYSVNFGPAEIHDGRFTLDALNLSVALDGDALDGTFAPAKLPVHLRRGGSFSPAPPPPVFPVAPAPAWMHPLGSPAWASPVAYEGNVYVGTVDGAFHAIRASDGVELWKWTGPQALYGAALATADSVYFVDDRCDLIALSRADGALRWRMPLHDEQLAHAPAPKNETFNHRATAPVIDAKGILYLGSTDGGVYAIRSKSGRKLWRHETKTKIYAPIALRGTDLIVGGFDGSVIALDHSGRREISRAKIGGPIVSAPVVAADRIVVGARDYLLYGLDGRSGAVAWRDSYWFSWVESTPRLVDGLLYVGGSDFRRVSALDPVNGQTRWATDVLGLSWGSPVVTGDTVFAGTAGQNLPGTVIKHTGGIVALDRKTGAARWRYAAPTADGAEFTGFPGSLVWVGGRIVGAGVDGTLVAIPAEK